MLPPPPAAFEREQGLTEADWLASLPGACGPQARLALQGPGQALVHIGEGRLRLRWKVLPERCIALIRMPRLQVSYSFEDLPDEARHAFMRHFTLYLQRGGG